jgi:hypothetical protein
MLGKHYLMLEKFEQLPNRLAAAIVGLDKGQLDLVLFHGSPASMAEMLCNRPAEAWKHYGLLTWLADDRETRLTVRDIVLIHLGHMHRHSTDIQAIRNPTRVERSLCHRSWFRSFLVGQPSSFLLPYLVPVSSRSGPGFS